MNLQHPLVDALHPITSRVRTDITAMRNVAGVQAWTKQPLTPERLAAHLNGGPARGVCPIKAGESVTMLAVLDFDSHKGETSWAAMSMVVAQVVEVLSLAWSAEPVLFRSTGGRGVHLYLLWDAPQDAYSVRQWLAGVLEACGLRNGVKGVVHGQVEIFPKQDEVPADGNGNQFILPLAGQSELLVLDELSGLLQSPDHAGKIAILDWSWCTTPPVPRLTKPERTVRAVEVAADAADAGKNNTWRSALAFIPNGKGGSESLDYDDWRNVIFAIHHETHGSDDGLALAEAFSSRSGKCDLDFLNNRVWPYIKTGDARGGQVITGQTIKSIASRYGWHMPIDDSAFDAIPEDGVDPGSDSERGDHESTAASDVPNAPVRRMVPPAEYRTTDQANAVRLVVAYGRRAVAAADRWYVDDGRHWGEDDAGITQYTCMLSKIVGDEAQRSETEANKESEDD